MEGPDILGAGEVSCSLMETSTGEAARPVESEIEEAAAHAASSFAGNGGFMGVKCSNKGIETL